jgi:hypothetical protein
MFHQLQRDGEVPVARDGLWSDHVPQTLRLPDGNYPISKVCVPSVDCTPPPVSSLPHRESTRKFLAALMLL